jgi:pimeloyl-ACP methyl ester carboxylesterase
MTIVLLHGATSSGRVWEPVLPMLSAKHRDHGIDDMGRQVGGMFGGERAASLADRRAHSVDDVCFGHSFNLT